jgi:hypothetical protein
VKDILNLERVLRTPRSAFAMNENCVDVCYTDPPNRGVLFHTQTLTSFIASKARGVLPNQETTFTRRNPAVKTSTERQHEVTL